MKQNIFSKKINLDKKKEKNKNKKGNWKIIANGTVFKQKQALLLFLMRFS